MTDPNQYPGDQHPAPQNAGDPYGQAPQYGQAAPYGQAPQYGQTPQGYPYAAAPDYGPRTNVLAIVALILGIVVPVAGIVTGHIALSQIKRTQEAGHGMALAGTVIGYVLTALTVLAVIGYFVFIIALVAGAASTSSSY